MSSIKITFSQIDTGAKANSTPTSTDKQSWVDMNDLKRDDITSHPYMTLEHNFSIFDTELEEFPDSPSELGWWTLSQSNDSGIFATAPILDVSFSALVKSKGITFSFYEDTDDYANEVTITWYASDLTTVIKTGNYEITRELGTVYEAVNNYKRVKIEFLSTNVRNRFVKLYAIDYGIIDMFDDEVVDSCNITEELTPISDMLQVNTMNFNIKTHTPTFSHISGNVEDDMMMKRQLFRVKANNEDFGLFFLEEWKDVNGNGTEFAFNSIDAFGVMDSYEFLGGMYSSKLVSELLTEIFALCFPTNLVKYSLDSSLTSATVTGYLPICNCREALQQIVFAIGAATDTFRTDTVKIYPAETVVSHEIPLEDIYIGGEYAPTPYYSGVELTSFDYTQGTEDTKIREMTMAVGDYLIKFDAPYHTLSITGGTITSSDTNYANINVATPGTVTLSGKNYIVNKLTHSQSGTVDAGQVKNICIFDRCTLVSNNSASSLLTILYDYLQNRTMAENEVMLKDLEAGHLVRIETYGRNIVGTIEKLDINLRGMRAKAKIIGNVEVI